MDKRKEQILGAIVKEYTRTARPVSSGLLCDKNYFEVSPATVRAEMLNLEKEGYLEQPHVSAGRIPSEKAYRYFVDNLINIKNGSLNQKEKDYIKSEIDIDSDNPHSLSRQIAGVIANVSDNFALSEIINTGEFFRAGFSKLFEMPEFYEYDRIFRIVSVFDEFERYLDMIFKDVFEESPKIVIGRENLIEDIYDETIITVNYPLPGGYNGAAAIIGPTRMRYDKNIALMEYISEFMSPFGRQDNKF